MNAEFAKDWIELQSELQTMPKDKSGYGYKYTDLDTIISNLKPLMKKHNIGFFQVLTTSQGITGVETYALHKTGETIGSFVAIPEIQVGKANNAQNIGAAITYFKRYALSALFGISSDEDVDCSTQIIEHNKKQMNAAKESVKPSPNEKTQSKTSSDKSSENTTKKYTKEQANALGSVMSQLNADGSPIFSEEEKTRYREMLMNGYFEHAIEDAKKVFASRIQMEVVSQEPLF